MASASRLRTALGAWRVSHLPAPTSGCAPCRVCSGARPRHFDLDARQDVLPRATSSRQPQAGSRPRTTLALTLVTRDGKAWLRRSERRVATSRASGTSRYCCATCIIVWTCKLGSTWRRTTAGTSRNPSISESRARTIAGGGTVRARSHCRAAAARCGVSASSAIRWCAQHHSLACQLIG